MRIGLFLLAFTLPACTLDSKPGTTEGENTSSSTSTASTGAPTSTAGMSSTGGDDDGVGAACKPVEGNTCVMGQTCCSDDPATVGGKIPNYYMDGVNNDEYGTPLFSDDNNALSFWGHCIETGGFLSPLANGCPVPCNPTWDAARLLEICGASAQCCSFTAVDPDKDCILVDGKWRAVRGEDIVAKRTGWGEAHSTNQDPFADSCKIFAQGDQAALLDCITQLGVADQRGYCYQGCPCVEDVCAQKNPDWVPRCTGNDPTSTSDGV